MFPRKQWRRDHPFGFYAKPARTPQGVLDLKKWECGVPGKAKTLWEGGLFKLDITFPDGMCSSAADVRIESDAQEQNIPQNLQSVRLESSLGAPAR